MIDCSPYCSPWSIEFDVDQAWCSSCGFTWYLACTPEGRPLGWRVSDYRRRVS